MYEVECPVCLETRRCVEQPNCKHALCPECYENIYCTKEIELPEFPFPELRHAYGEENDDGRLTGSKWNDYREEIYEWDSKCLALIEERKRVAPKEDTCTSAHCAVNKTFSQTTFFIPLRIVGISNSKLHEYYKTHFADIS